jgi:hypothetical protein
MGTYIYTFKKKFNKKVILDGQEVIVGQATFLCRQDWLGNYSPSENREMTRAYALTKNDQPEYITFEGDIVYKNNKKGVWSDGSGFWSGIDYKEDLVGTLKKEGRKYKIINTK